MELIKKFSNYIIFFLNLKICHSTKISQTFSCKIKIGICKVLMNLYQKFCCNFIGKLINPSSVPFLSFFISYCIRGPNKSVECIIYYRSQRSQVRKANLKFVYLLLLELNWFCLLYRTSSSSHFLRNYFFVFHLICIFEQNKYVIICIYLCISIFFCIIFNIFGIQHRNILQKMIMHFQF